MLTLTRSVSWRLNIPFIYKKMSTCSFVQRLNPINNKMEWKIITNDYDYNQEIATSCYGDMLHDDERNKKFGAALKKAIDKVHSTGKKAHVLDIGTGTGILSMVAVQHGADSVVACELFPPIANCARSIIKENNLSEKIKIVTGHSTSLTVGENHDLPQKANVLISEVFDTELIGEGAIKTFNHAFENLLEENCVVVPFAGTVYAQVVESDLALKWNRLEDWYSGADCLIKIPEAIKNCPGAAAVHDIQLSEFKKSLFKPISEVIPIFRFEWAKHQKIPTHEEKKITTKAIASGKAQIVFMWWDLEMDQDKQIIISCAPVWEHPDAKGKNKEDVRNLTKLLPWRDHWMQAVYFLPKETVLNLNDAFTLVGNHDEFSFWFQIEGSSKELQKPICNCTFHFLLSRTRIGAMNDNIRREKYFQSLRTLIKKDTICIVLSDITLLSFMSAKLGAKKVHILIDGPSVKQVPDMLSAENDLTDVISVNSNFSEIISSIDQESNGEVKNILIVAEPYFRNSILPWDNMAIWYMKEDVINTLKGLKNIGTVQTYPLKSKLKCCAIQFDNLWKIARPLNVCEGFSMKIFDNLIGTAKEMAENYAEAQPLWEYPGIALTLPKTIFEFDYTDSIPKKDVKSSGHLEIGCDGRCDGIAFWMDYELTKDITISFGPVEDIVINNYITWDMFERQGVHLFRDHHTVKAGEAIYFESLFDPEEAEFDFHFDFKSKK